MKKTNLFFEKRFIYQEAREKGPEQKLAYAQKMGKEKLPDRNVGAEMTRLELDWGKKLGFPLVIDAHNDQEAESIMGLMEKWGIELKGIKGNISLLARGTSLMNSINEQNSKMEISQREDRLTIKLYYSDEPKIVSLDIMSDGSVKNGGTRDNMEEIKKMEDLNRVLVSGDTPGMGAMLKGMGLLKINPIGTMITRGGPAIKANLEGGFDVMLPDGDLFERFNWSKATLEKMKIDARGMQNAESKGFELDETRPVLHWKSRNDEGYFLFSVDDEKPGFVSVCKSGKSSVHHMSDKSGIVMRKPVIYLYPEKEQEIMVKVDYKGDFTTVYPRFKNGSWQVFAKPDGTLYEKDTGREFKYLFWEGIPSQDPEYDFSKGFCVHRDEAEKFLEEKLRMMGLNTQECNDMVVYWLPFLEKNTYSIVHFAQKEYTDIAKLKIDPKPDSILRVFMVFRSSEKRVEIEPQKIETFKRKGFTVVEWGGSDLEEQKLPIISEAKRHFNTLVRL